MITCKTKDHPEANGRQAQPGEQQWILMFELENGERLNILIGKLGHDAIKSMFEQEEIDDLAEGPASGN